MASTPLHHTPWRREVDHRTLKLVVGLIALTLPSLTDFFAHQPLTSISASYYEDGWSHSIFIGFLFAIASFLLAYNGQTPLQMRLSKVACVAALGVALFPCACGNHESKVQWIHSACSAAMFLVLAFFCYVFYRTAQDKRHLQARIRAVIYASCGVAMLLSLFGLAYDGISGTFTRWFPDFTFYGEATGLIAFGISWLTASRVLPVITAESERFSLLRANNPP